MKRKKLQSSGGINTKGSPFNGLFENLAHIIDVSRSKFDNCHIKNAEKLRFGKLIVEAARAYGQLFEMSALDDLRARISELEKGLAKQLTEE